MFCLSNGEIDRLGDKIRRRSSSLEDEVLLELQNYRTSHQNPLANIFKIICKIAKSIHYSSIATYRIKRFESIINKLDRYPKMRFSRMWDIAGCRIILKDIDELYKTIDKIKSDNEIEIVKITDYLQNPNEDGYKSIHIYLKHISSKIVVELQLRSLQIHNWATLVEITDLIYKTRLKEIGDDKELQRFHKLLSEVGDTSIDDKHEILRIVKKRGYFEKLSEVFSKNYLLVRKQWLILQSKTNHKYFLIEVINNTPTIKSFASFKDAEQEYFELYKNKVQANVVLTYLQNHNYELLATAYANYILTYHIFLYECLGIIEALIVDCLKEKKYIQLLNVYNFYNELIYRFNKNIIQEIDDSYKSQFQDLTHKERNIYKKKRNEWIDDIQKQLNKIIENQRAIHVTVRQHLGNAGYKSIIPTYIIKFSNFKYRKLNRRLFKKSIVLSPLLKNKK